MRYGGSIALVTGRCGGAAGSEDHCAWRCDCVDLSLNQTLGADSDVAATLNCASTHPRIFYQNGKLFIRQEV
jgi:hypothetical protein